MIEKLYRIGVLGLSHDHVWGNLDDLVSTPGGVLVSVADPNQPLLDKAHERYDCGVYRDFEELLDREQLDAVYIFADNATTVGLGEAAAAKNLHIMVEKPMAADLEGADRLLAAARSAGTRLMVNWPFAWWPQLQLALEMTRLGAIGDVFQVKYRAAHAGPKELGCSPYFCQWLYDAELNGGGALIDYGCYGALLARAILGMPARVYAAMGRFVKEDILIEDNGLLVMNYPRAMALAEASWSQIGNLTSYTVVIYGTTGTLLVEPGRNGRLLLATDEHRDGAEVQVPEPANDMSSASAHFLNSIRRGTPHFVLCQDRVSRDAQEILEAGFFSAESGGEVSLPLRL